MAVDLETTQPLVTVAMVTYNSSQYVQTAIDSVLASTYEHFELIISDDCSTDNTWELIQSYDDPRIVTNRNTKNLQEYPNRYKCIQKAKGDYLIFIDGDDYIYPHGLSHYINGALLDKDAAMVISHIENDHIIYPVKLTPEQMFKYEYLGDSFTSDSFVSTLFKTSCIKKIEPQLQYTAGDIYIKRVLAFEYSTILIHSGLTWWRSTPGQAFEKTISPDYSINNLIEYVKINQPLIKKYQHFLDEREFELVQKRFYKPVYRQLLKLLISLKLQIFIQIIRSIDVKWKYCMSIFEKKNYIYKIASSSVPLHIKK